MKTRHSKKRGNHNGEFKLATPAATTAAWGPAPPVAFMTSKIMFLLSRKSIHFSAPSPKTKFFLSSPVSNMNENLDLCYHESRGNTYQSLRPEDPLQQHIGHLQRCWVVFVHQYWKWDSQRWPRPPPAPGTATQSPITVLDCLRALYTVIPWNSD